MINYQEIEMTTVSGDNDGSIQGSPDSYSKHGPSFSPEKHTDTSDNEKPVHKFLNIQEQNQDEESLSTQFLTVFKLAVTPILSMFFQFFVTIVNTYQVGKLGDPTLMAAVGLGSMMINVVCIATTAGLNSALETFVSQSYGAGNFKQCGVYLNRGRTIVCAVLTPLSFIMYFSEEILILIGQDKTISYVASKYMIILIPGIWAMTHFDANRRFMISQRKNQYPFYLQLATMIIHILVCHLFVSMLGYGIEGAAWALNINSLLNLIISDIIIHRGDDFILTKSSLDKTCLQEWKNYLKIGIPGTMTICLEWWAFEFLAIFSGYMGVNQLAAEVIVINLVTFIYMMPFGISMAASSLTGNSIGKGNIALAKRYGNLTMFLGLILSVFIIIIVIVFDDSIVQIFTQDHDVQMIVKDMLWIMVTYIFLDGIHAVQSGIIKGIGQQKLNSIIALVSYYCFGLPLALYFGFSLDMKLGGLWLGYVVATILLDIGLQLLIMLTDWNKCRIIS